VLGCLPECKRKGDGRSKKKQVAGRSLSWFRRPKERQQKKFVPPWLEPHLDVQYCPFSFPYLCLSCSSTAAPVLRLKQLSECPGEGRNRHSQLERVIVVYCVLSVHLSAVKLRASLRNALYTTSISLRSIQLELGMERERQKALSWLIPYCRRSLLFHFPTFFAFFCSWGLVWSENLPDQEPSAKPQV